MRSSAWARRSACIARSGTSPAPTPNSSSSTIAPASPAAAAGARSGASSKGNARPSIVRAARAFRRGVPLSLLPAGNPARNLPGSIPHPLVTEPSQPMPPETEVRGGSVPFATLGLPPILVKGVRAAGFAEPTPLQRKAIPIILKGNDLIGVAQSGTGKTASYLLPTLTRLIEGPRRLRALVLVPTRELAAQVESSARVFGRFLDLRVAAVFPGVPLAPQERVVREEGVELLIATPVRLLELHSRQALNFEDVEILVLDEADRMVDMGFAADLRRILKALPETRQTLLFCATLPPELNRLAKEALVEPLRVDLAPPSKPAAGIMQAVYPVPRQLKTDLLHEILTRNEVRSVIIYANTRHAADQLARQLQKRGHTVGSLHDSD